MFNKKGEPVILEEGSCLAYFKNDGAVFFMVLPSENSPVEDALSWSPEKYEPENALLYSKGSEGFSRAYLMQALAAMANMKIKSDRFPYSDDYRREDGLNIVLLRKV
jgi:hypothetical protein